MPIMDGMKRLNDRFRSIICFIDEIGGGNIPDTFGPSRREETFLSTAEAVAGRLID